MDMTKEAANVAKTAAGVATALQNMAVAIVQRANSDGIPESPIANMANVFLTGNKGSLALLQGAIDHLTAKAKAAKPFTDDDKKFMTEVFESIWVGGTYKTFYEAAILANHYVNGNGATLFINPDCYINSTIVRDTMTAMVEYLRSSGYLPLDYFELLSSDPVFEQSTYAAPLKGRSRKLNTQGQLLAGGVLLAEQDNHRLKNADHRFRLKVTGRRSSVRTSLQSMHASLRNTYNCNLQGNLQWLTGIGTGSATLDSLKMLGSDITLTWRVDSVYDFEPFPTTYYTPLPLGPGIQVRMPDGLSEYITRVGVAKVFDYYSEW